MIKSVGRNKTALLQLHNMQATEKDTQYPHHFWNEWTLCLLGSHKTEAHIITIVAKHLLISACLIPSTFYSNIF